jgi:uncharacterized cupin superfamily protein
MSNASKPSACLLRRSDLEALPLTRFVHQHNSKAVRHTTCLTDPLGFRDMGVHLVHLEPGDASSEHYPRLGLRQYRIHGKREFVREEDLKRLS